MKKKIKLLIVSLIIIAGIVFGIHYVSNASIFDGAFGKEIVNITDNIGEIVATYTHSTGESTDSILNRMNSKFEAENIKGSGGDVMEDIMISDFYSIPGIFCVKHRKDLKSYAGQFASINHGSQYNMYEKIDFDKDFAYGVQPKLKTSPTVWKTVYEAGTEGKCCDSLTTQTIYSNFNGIKIYSGNLHSIFTHYNSYNNNHRIPYIISFNENTSNLHTNPSESQKALWGFTGDFEYCGTDCKVYPELDLHKAGIAVEEYMNTKDKYGTEPKVSLPAGAQAGSAYYSYGSFDFEEVTKNMEVELKKELETQKIISDGIVRVGPFVMGDYAYAFSEYVADYSNKGLEWNHVVAGIVAGEVTISNGGTIPIVAREEGSEFIHTSDGTVIDGSGSVVGEDKIGASIVYKDWYNQVPMVYKIEDDVRGDASREFKTELNGKQEEILYKPIIDNTEGAGEYSTGFTERGSKQLFPGEAKDTTEKLKVKVKDENGNYTVDYPFPLPNSVFYVEIPVSLCGTAESILTSISFTYRTTESTGTGDVIISRTAKSVLNFKESEYSGGGDVTTDATKCDTYYCQNETPSYADHHTSEVGGTQTCTYEWDCDDHDEGCGCAGDHHDHTCTDTCSGSSRPNCNCACDGHSGTHSSLFLCVHNHSDCENGHWIVNNSDLSTEYGQPLLVVHEAKTEVTETKVDSLGLDVRILETIKTKMEIVCVWHGWDSLEGRGNSVKDMVNDEGFFDDIEALNWGENDIKSAELGDRIVYRVTVNHSASVPLYIWLRIKYPVAMLADDVTSPEVYQNGPEEFYGERYASKYGGWFSKDTSIGEDGETKQRIGAKEMTKEGEPRTLSARAYVRSGMDFIFFFEYTLTKEIKATIKSKSKLIANTPTLQITSLDYKWKTEDNPNIEGVNVDFTRTCALGARWKGPVITQIFQDDEELIVKRYVVNLNKYIYNVDHQNTAVTGLDTSIIEDDSRGYKFTNGSTNLYSLAELPAVYENQEKLKEANPVYVEYGDRITYKIEVGNGKITDRDTVADFDYDVDDMYVTLVDELPKKYSNMEITIDSVGYRRDGSKTTPSQGAHLTMPNYPKEWDSDTAGPTIEFKDLLIPRNGVTTITISFDIEEYEKGTIEQNKAYVKEQIVYDYNRGPNKEPWNVRTSDVSNQTTIIGASSDWYILNDYKIDIDKYVSSYQSDVHDANQAAGLTNETPKINSVGILSNLSGSTQAANEDMQRLDWAEDVKFNDPVQVEKDDIIMYSIKLENLAVSSLDERKAMKANKPATQVRVSKMKEEMHPGLEYQDVYAYIYADGGGKLRDVTAHVNHTDLGGNIHEFKLDHVTDTLLDPNEYIVFYIKVKVTESNMSLEKLYNHAEIVTLSNINPPNTTDSDSNEKDARLIKTEPGKHTDIYNENIEPQEKMSEYVRLKDLVIAGKVWLDKDRDGLMEAEDFDLLSDREKTRYGITGTKAGKPGVVVKLYKADGTLVRTTFTDNDGLYTFSQSNGAWCTNSFESSGPTYNPNTQYQRIDKATDKDQYGNYQVGTSQFIDYYIEYEYDGVIYKSTEVYSTGVYPPGEDQGMTNLTGDGNYNSKYEIDSNAFEKPTERAEFNRKYEYISYNSAFDINKGNKTQLEFKKYEHISELEEDKTRVIRSRSFINNKTGADNFLWLYDYKGTGETLPNTEYLKYINLGLELREEVDIALTKDVYKVKTTINGETMEYDFNQNDGLNGVDTGLGGTNTGSSEYLNDFIIKKAYGLEIYESDYKFRIDQYFADEVRKYKEITSELNIEVTYRITVDNKAISDADDIKNTGRTVTETALKVQVNEIMDVYEDNFIKYGDRPNNEITVKTKDANGYLVDTKIQTIEAWYFKEQAGGNYKVVNANSGDKPIYIETTSGGTHAKIPLTISTGSIYTDNGVNYTGYGYNKLYITGMDNEYITEDNDLDIYIKYTLDKGETEVEVTNTAYSETVTTETKTFGSADLGDTYGSYSETIVVNSSSGKATMQRSLKIKETTANRTNDRGIENIAQVNAYSVWYEDNSPASLVDRNSNAGNLGFDNNGAATSPDNITYYEDTTYKTGIVIVAEGTGWGKDDTIIEDKYGEIEIHTSTPVDRIIEGTVWDDARTTTIGSTPEIQYVGDGLFNSDTHSMTELMNENVELNYKPEGNNYKEDKDFGVRSVKAEFIEIVKVPNSDPDTSTPTENHYYEQVLQNVTWQQVQHTRTKIDGKYQLEGFVPGTYIVRFTYGDTVVGDANAAKEMQIFNGQDYKSTQYNTEMLALENNLNLDDINTSMDIDTVIKILEKANTSDARDDERRRLEVNSYSEIMTNEIAEILKGVGNGSLRTDGKTSITTNKTPNSPQQLKELTDNTYMYAETVEFLVKPEKLTNEQQQLAKYLILSTSASASDIFYKELEAIQKEERNARTFKISNIDLGIEYRPESEIRLVKEIEEVKLTTEDGEVLVDLFFYTEGEGKDTKHIIDKSKSKGTELVQFKTNSYKNALLNKLTEEETQGFVYIQIDEDILQGSTIQIVYKFEAENNSQVDRISINLDEIRYKENPAAISLVSEYPETASIANQNYTASGVAAKVVDTDMFREDTQGVEYRILPKTITSEAKRGTEQEKKAYFGKYVGYGYYTGELSNELDTVSSLKFDKILDYIDVNLEYKQESDQENTLDRFWAEIVPDDLTKHLYQLRSSVNISTSVSGAKQLLNKEGYIYDTLVVSVDDRTKDDKYSSPKAEFQGVDNSAIRNNDLSRFLLPKVTDTTEEQTKSIGTVRLPVSKVLAAETGEDDMSYENMAEIIQFTTLTGRRTNFATTIGNADVQTTSAADEVGSIEFVASTFESDTAATETVTLMPPTGLMRNRRAIVNIVETAKKGVEVIFVLATIVVVIIVFITAILFAMKKYRKRRIR